VNFYKCYHCKKEGHTRKYCTQRHKKANNLDRPFGFGRRPNGESTFGEIELVEDNCESSEILMVENIADDLNGT